MRLYNKIQVLKVLNQHLGVYPTPINLNWSWSWGSLSGLLLGSQIVTGILLAMHYVGHVDHAFASVQHLMVDVPSGLILRYAHANGASLFFTVVYLHVLRGIYYSSGNQPREIVWISGVVILLLMIITAFIGYVLPWGLLISPKCFVFENLSNYLGLGEKTSYITLNCLMGVSKQVKTETRLTDKDIEILSNLNKKMNPIIISTSIGTLLGDAHCERRSKTGNARLTLKQTDKHSEWLLWLHGLYSTNGFASLERPTLKTASLKSTGLNYSYYKFNTYSVPFSAAFCGAKAPRFLLRKFSSLHRLFYTPNLKGYTKQLDSSLFNYLDACALAAWVSDDGLTRNGSTAFCTDSFSPGCLDILIDIFNDKFGIKVCKYKHTNYTRLRIAREDMPKFATLVKPYLHTSMIYKLGDFK